MPLLTILHKKMKLGYERVAPLIDVRVEKALPGFITRKPRAGAEILVASAPLNGKLLPLSPT